MKQELALEIEMFSDLQRFAVVAGLHEKPEIMASDEDGMDSRGIMFDPLPGFHFGVCSATHVRTPQLANFFLDEPTFMVILVMEGSSSYTFKTRGGPSFTLQKNMFLLGYWDNVALDMLFPEQDSYSHIAFYIRELALKSYLGESSHSLILERIFAAAPGTASGAAATGLASPELLIQARQFLDWQEERDLLGLRCATLDCFAKFFSNPSVLEESTSPFIYEQDKKRMAKLKEDIEENFLTIETATDICASCGMSFSKANKVFKALYSTTIANYIHHCKMAHAYSLLVNRKCNVSECAFEVGYSNISHFIAAFKKSYRITPKAATRMRPEMSMAG